MQDAVLKHALLALQVLATLSSDPELASMNQKTLKQTGEIV